MDRNAGVPARRESMDGCGQCTTGGSGTRVGDRGRDRFEAVGCEEHVLVRELAASLQDLDEVVAADPLNAELQQARYDVYEALRSSEAAGALGHVRTGVYFTKLANVDTGVRFAKRKRSDGENEKEHRGSDADKNGENTQEDNDDSDRINAMNTKNLYSRREFVPDFIELAKQYPVLRKHLQGQGMTRKYNFKSWEACRDLVAVQFEHDFGVRSWTVPAPHLVPPLANRLNYLCYIHDLLEMDGLIPGRVISADRARGIRILDVGCGANLVYPLLAAAYFQWSSIGCDVNEAALRHAAKVRDANPHIAPLIILRHLGWLDALREEHVDAMVCNPPFFDQDAGELAGQNPRTDYGGTRVEMWCSGGEEAFVVNLIRESQRYKDRCLWFSSMCGKKRTLKDAKAELEKLRNQDHKAGEDKKEEQAEHDGVRSVTYRVRTLEQGSTTRWVVAWSWHG